jgi:serine-type D-Ala-D-Ala carboxypeptidase (penicillin-binding protein 5/6)
MKNKIKFFGIMFLGIGIGIYVGYIAVLGIGKTYSFASTYIKSISFSFLKIETGLGGPDFAQTIFAKSSSEESISNYKKSYKINNNAPVPKVEAKSYLVGDIETGEIILVKNENQPLPIASITKLMTSVIADESNGLSELVKVSQRAIDTYGKQGRLAVNETYKVSEIMYPLILESSNDAAEAIAESFDRNTFIQNMNEKANEIGMNNTNFSDPSGLSSRNISTVSDLFKLSRYVDQYRNYIFNITSLNVYKFNNKTWYNNSKFKSDKNYYGGKNGYIDEAGHTQVVIFDMNFKGDNRKIAFIILNTSDLETNIYGLKNYVSKYVSYE